MEVGRGGGGGGGDPDSRRFCPPVSVVVTVGVGVCEGEAAAAPAAAVTSATPDPFAAIFLSSTTVLRSRFKRGLHSFIHHEFLTFPFEALQNKMDWIEST